MNYNNIKTKYNKLNIKKDPIFYNKLILFLINKLIKNGKKSITSKIIYKIINKLEKKTKNKSIYILFQSIYKNEIFISNNFPKLYELKYENRIKKFFNTFLNNLNLLKTKLKKTVIIKISFKIFLLSK